MNDEKFLDINQAAAFLGMKAKGVRKLVADRKIKYYRLSDSNRGRLRFLRSDLLQYMQGNCVDVREKLTPDTEKTMIRGLFL